MNRGLFITLEGTEGVGKSTQLAFIRQYLLDAGKQLEVTREPGGTPLAEQMRELLLAPREEPICVDAELLMVFAARAQHLAQRILPALNAGRWVLSDRFTDATFAYQGAGRGIDTVRIGQLESLVQGDLQPDCTFWLDAPVELGMQRARQRGEPDRFEREQMAFFQRVREGYLARSQQYPERFVRIDASGSIEQVQQQLQAALDKLLSGV